MRLREPAAATACAILSIPLGRKRARARGGCNVTVGVAADDLAIRRGAPRARISETALYRRPRTYTRTRRADRPQQPLGQGDLPACPALAHQAGPDRTLAAVAAGHRDA